MKYLIMIGLVVSSFALAWGQENDPTTVSSIEPLENTLAVNPLYVRSIRGSAKIISKDEFEKIDVDQIDYVTVINDERSLYIYGDKGKNGVVLIVMKNGSSAEKYGSRKRRQK